MRPALRYLPHSERNQSEGRSPERPCSTGTVPCEIGEEKRAERLLASSVVANIDDESLYLIRFQAGKPFREFLAQVVFGVLIRIIPV